MATVNAASLRDEFEAAKAGIAALRKDGKVSAQADAMFRILITLMSVLITILLERTTRKSDRNASLPPSQTPKDETAQRASRSSGKGTRGNGQTSATLRKVIHEETVTVETYEACGLSHVDPVDRERRILYDIVFEVVERRVEAEVKECLPHQRALPRYHAAAVRPSRPSSSTCSSPTCSPCGEPWCRRSPVSHSPRPPV